MLRRNISVPLPETLQRRLSSPECKAFVEIVDRGPGGNDLKSYQHYDEQVEAAYNRLTVVGKQAIEDRFDILALESDIESYIRRKSYEHLSLRSISNVDQERSVIEELRKIYVYPDYSEIVGSPHDEDFIEYSTGPGLQERSRVLTYVRRADLLLLGAFPWKGMYIAKADDMTALPSSGWLVCLSEDYVPSDWLCACYSGTSSRYLVFQPFRGFITLPLHEHLFACDVELKNRAPLNKNEKIGFLDGNPFNCLPNNLITIPKAKRGRKMICQRCHKETTAQESTVIRDRGGKARYCNACIRRTAFTS